MKRIFASFLALGLVTGPIMAAPAVAQPRSEQGEARREMMGLCALLPLTGTDLRSPVDGCVTASDACETGLGVSRSVCLSKLGAETEPRMR